MKTIRAGKDAYKGDAESLLVHLYATYNVPFDEGYKYVDYGMLDSRSLNDLRVLYIDWLVKSWRVAEEVERKPMHQALPDSLSERTLEHPTEEGSDHSEEPPTGQDYGSDSSQASSMFSNAAASSVTSIGGTLISDELITEFTKSLFCTEQMSHLNSAAIVDPDVGPSKFRKNIRRLIVAFGDAVNSERDTMYLCREAGKLLRRRNMSYQLAQDILIQTILQNELRPRTGGAREQVSNVSTADEDQPDEYANDDESGISEDSDDAETNERIAIAFNDIKHSLAISEAWATFRSQLLTFVHRAYEKRIMTALGKDLMRGSNRMNSSMIRRCGREISWAPPNILGFTNRVRHGSTDHLKRWVEDEFGERWNWWPLRRRTIELQPGYERLTWHSVSTPMHLLVRG